MICQPKELRVILIVSLPCLKLIIVEALTINNIKTLNEVVIDRINHFLVGPIGTQYALAEISGVPYPTIKSIMQRRTKGITLKTIFMLAQAFNVSVSDFFNDESFRYENLELE